jgi:hypothetical protein
MMVGWTHRGLAGAAAMTATLLLAAGGGPALAAEGGAQSRNVGAAAAGAVSAAGRAVPGRKYLEWQPLVHKRHSEPSPSPGRP